MHAYQAMCVRQWDGCSVLEGYIWAQGQAEAGLHHSNFYSIISPTPFYLVLTASLHDKGVVASYCYVTK